MMHFLHLLFHEVRLLFIAPATYIAATLFLVLMGIIYLLGIDAVSSGPQENLPSDLFFQLFWIPVFFMVPLLTMKSIAEERRLGTLETLLSTPPGSLQIVLSKFFAAYLLYLLCWALTLCFPLIVYFSLPSARVDARLLDPASLLGGYSFIAISGTLFIALGLFSSSLTRSTLVAGMLSFSLLFVIILGGRLLLEQPFMEVGWLQWMDDPIDYLHAFRHLDYFSRGVIDTRPFFFYLSNALLLLGITSLVVESKA